MRSLPFAIHFSCITIKTFQNNAFLHMNRINPFSIITMIRRVHFSGIGHIVISDTVLALSFDFIRILNIVRDDDGSRTLNLVR